MRVRPGLRHELSSVTLSLRPKYAKHEVTLNFGLRPEYQTKSL